MAKKYSLTIEAPDDTQPIEAGAKTKSIRGVINHLKGFLGGATTGTMTVKARTDQVAATGTITLASCAAGTVVEINGVDFMAKGSAATAGNNEFDISGNDTADAAALAAAINASTSTGIYNVVSATSASNVVTVTSLLPGALGSALTIRTGGIRANGTATCSAVDAADAITINGVAITAVASGAGNNQFNVGATDAATATNLAAAINASTSALVNQHVKALARSAVVYIYAKYDGTPGNNITLTTNDGTDLAVSGARLTGGTVASCEGVQASAVVTCASVAAADTVTINGQAITAHATTEADNQFSIAGTDSADATSLAKAINDSPTAVVQDVIAVESGAAVTISARRGGVSGNAITIATSNGTRLAITGDASGRLANGAAATTVVLSSARLTSGAETFVANFTN